MSVVFGPGFKFTPFERVIKITARYGRDADGRILEFGVYRPLGGKLWLFTILS